MKGVDTLGLAPHFDGTGYPRWKVLMEDYLQARDLDVCVNTKNWYRKEADLWAELGNKFRSAGKGFFSGFGKNACGRQCVFVRQKDCLRWIRGITW
jgi:hypothetical protein